MQGEKEEGDILRDTLAKGSKGKKLKINITIGIRGEGRKWDEA